MPRPSCKHLAGAESPCRDVRVSAPGCDAAGSVAFERAQASLVVGDDGADVEPFAHDVSDSIHGVHHGDELGGQVDLRLRLAPLETLEPTLQPFEPIVRRVEPVDRRVTSVG